MDLFLAFLATLARIFILSGIFWESSVLSSRYMQYGFNLSLLSSFACAAFVVTFYNVILYPMVLDPLRKYPLVHINDMRIVFPVTDVPRGDPALEWAKRYPDADAIRVRINHFTTMLVPMSPEALRDVFSTNEKDFTKPLSGRSWLARILGHGLIVTEGSHHARQRKQVLPHFRIQNIRALHELMLAKTELLLQKMSQESEQLGKVEITNWASKATLDIIGTTLMSKDFNSLQVHFQPENEAFSQLTAANPGQTFIFGIGLLLPQFIVTRLPTATNRMIQRNTRTIQDTCEEVLSDLYDNKSIEHDSKRPDILSSLIQDRSIPRQEIIDQMRTFLGAGHETTATAVAWVTHLLTLPENKHYQLRIREEVHANPGCTLSPNELERLPWVNAVCEETLRLFPSVTTTARVAIRNTSIAGTKICKRQLVIIFPWATNRNPRFWGGSDSERFVPERWLDTLPDGNLRANKHGGATSNYCETTFLHGNRSCIGKDFAKAELRCIVSKMYSEYDVARLPGDDGTIRAAGSITIKPADGLFIKLTPATS